MQIETFGHLEKNHFSSLSSKCFLSLASDHPVVSKTSKWCWLFNDLTQDIQWANRAQYLVLSQYAISSQSNRQTQEIEVDRTDQTPENGQKNPFLVFWIIQKGIIVIFEWSSMGDMAAHLSRSFCIIKICNLKSIRCT